MQTRLDRGLDVTRGRLAVEGEDLQLGQVVNLSDLPAVEIVTERFGIGEFRADDQPAPRSFAVEAREEAQEYSEFDYMVVNDDLERTVESVAAIVRAERLRTERRAAEAMRILATFPS